MCRAAAPEGRIHLYRGATRALNVIVNYATATTNHADRSAAGLYAGRLAETLARITGALEAHSARQQQIGRRLRRPGHAGRRHGAASLYPGHPWRPQRRRSQGLVLLAAAGVRFGKKELLMDSTKREPKLETIVKRLDNKQRLNLLDLLRRR